MNGIGLFGGTFNPLHSGHLQVAEEVKAGFNLEKIYFIPSAVPPHKGTDDLAEAMDRYRMIDAEMSARRGFVVSDVEIHRRGPSYTIDTVRYFKDKLPAATPCFLIMGMDAFLEIDTWKSYQKLFDQVPMIVMTRPLEDAKQTVQSAALEKYIHAHVDARYKYITPSSCFDHPEKHPVHLFPVTPINISSTKIRNRIRRGLSIKEMVPVTVENYIHKKGLYL